MQFNNANRCLMNVPANFPYDHFICSLSNGHGGLHAAFFNHSAWSPLHLVIAWSKEETVGYYCHQGGYEDLDPAVVLVEGEEIFDLYKQLEKPPDTYSTFFTLDPLFRDRFNESYESLGVGI